MNKFFLFATCLLLTSFSFAQEKGFLRGNIMDGDFGEPAFGANVLVVEMPGVGTPSDFEGNYSLPLAPGTYTIEVRLLTYSTLTFPNIVIKAGEVTVLDAVLKSAATELGVVEIVAEANRSRDEVLLLDMKEAANVSDGLGSQSMRKVGDSDLGGAMRRVTGVTVANGKYVYVRGLGDRYSKTTLNGMTLPGLDPDVNAVQIDIFPTNVLENVAVSKSFTPDLDGDFTGGLVNVVTKNFPDEKTTQVQLGLTFVPGMHFDQRYLNYAHSNLNWTGYDFGTRALPFSKTAKVPNPVLNDATQEDITRSFDPTLATKKAMAYPNGSLMISHGNQVNRESGGTIGYNLVFNYSNETSLYKDYEANDFRKDNDLTVNELQKMITRKGEVGKNSVLWTALASGSYKKKNSTITLMFLNSQSAESSATKRISQDFEATQATLSEDILTYSQRTLTTGIIAGKHRIGITELHWSNALSRSRVYDPDFRESKINISEGLVNLSTGNGAGLFRFWRDLHEYTESFKVDLKIPVSESAYLKFGAATTLKWRNFETYSYKHTRRNLSDVSADPNWYLLPENIWSADVENPNNQSGTYTIGTYQKANTYDANQQIYAGYGMIQHNLFKVFKLIYGARLEQTFMYYTGQDNTGLESYENEQTLNQLSVLPSFNFVYEISDKMNIRGGANRTLARPSFREKSIAQIYDPVTKRTFNGNIDLQQTNINNYDLRYEYFISPRELFSVAVFFKQFDGHIELVSFRTAPDNVKPRNSGLAQVIGTEFELRKAIAPNASSEFWQRFFFNTNVSLVKSMVDLKSVQVDNSGETEYELRENNLRTGEKLEQFRPMAGQSPYAINAGLSYEIPESQTSIALAYNVQGDQLSIIASGRVPDVYTLAFHSLNINAYRNFGAEKRSRVTVGVQNILNDDRTLVYRSYGATDQVFTTYKPGVAFKLRYNYTF